VQSIGCDRPVAEIDVAGSPDAFSSICHQSQEGLRDLGNQGEDRRSLGVLQIRVVRLEGNQLSNVNMCFQGENWCNIRGPPPGGPPRPGKPGGPPNPGAPGKPPPNPGPGPPTPGAGPVRPTGRPRPAGRATPGPAASVAAVVGPLDAAPSRAAGSAGGGPSTDSEMTCAPRMMVRPIARRSSVSVTCCVAPGAALPRRRVRRNSSVSARTRFMCCERISSSYAVRLCDTDLVKCEHLPDHLPTILKCYLHAVVDLRLVSSMRSGAEVGALTRFCYIIRRQSVLHASSLRSRTRAAGQVYLPSFPVCLRRQTCRMLRVRRRLEAEIEV
jgi:hypothetical protein